MAKSDTTQDLGFSCTVDTGNALRKSALGRLRGRLGRCAAGISTFTLGISVAVMAAAQQGSSGVPKKDQFELAPRAPEPEAEMIEQIFGIPVNTLFFIAAGVIAVFWFTLGGGRKPKVTRH